MCVTEYGPLNCTRDNELSLEIASMTRKERDMCFCSMHEMIAK